MPADLVAQYEHATFRDILRENFPPSHGIAGRPVSADAAQEHAQRAQYYAAASSVDRQVGEVLAELDHLGLRDDTLIIYTGDHGLNAGQHGMWEKGNATQPQNFFDESIRVSCTLSWPSGGIPRNMESDLHVNHCDLFATLLEVAHAVPNDTTTRAINSPGQSYLAHLRGEITDRWRNGSICEYGNARMIRKDAYKVILRYPYGGFGFPSEFYDLKADPRETINLYSSQDAAHQQTIQQLMTELNAYFTRYTTLGRSGLHMEDQPIPTSSSPWLGPARAHAGKKG